MMRDETEESCWCCLTCDDAQVGSYTAQPKRWHGCEGNYVLVFSYGHVMDDVETDVE